ncbi:MAG: uracil-DNA glycosylase family protein [Bacteroidota bacterium]
MKKLLREIQGCRVCEAQLSHGPRPVLTASPESKIVIIGQAPGIKVHQSGIPWDDASGKRLRNWLGIEGDLLYDTRHFAIIPMGFCYPGKGSSGDLPPRKECAPQWHADLWEQLTSVKLTLLIGTYAQKYYLGKRYKGTLTETVRHYTEYLPQFFPLVHPSPLNHRWLKRNPWFAAEVLPVLRSNVQQYLSESDNT